ncbi:MAG: lipid-A-disaccharide synthase, partial [Alphaproteobacteria bacterium]
AATGKGQIFRKNYLIGQNTLVVCMLPGSRRNEVAYLLPIFKAAVERLAEKYPDMCVVVPTVKTVIKRVQEQMKNWRIPYVIVEGEQNRYDAFAASDVAVAASGTVSLELAMANVPHLIAYKVNKLTGWLARRLLKIKYVNLINLLSDKEIIPELLQENCTPEKMAAVLENLIAKKEPDMRRYLSVLGFGAEMTPSELMAGHIIRLVQRRQCK